MNSATTETLQALDQKQEAVKISKLKKKFAKAYVAIASTMMATSMVGTSAFADDVAGFSTQDVNLGNEANADTLMGNIIGILLTMTQYVGIALCVYGVYEIVMSFMQNQPEAKTKGIIMALSGVVMIGLKSILKAMNVIA